MCCLYVLSALTFLLFQEVCMARRGRMSRGHSRRNFRKAAVNIHPKNVLRVGPMRGGIRL